VGFDGQGKWALMVNVVGFDGQGKWALIANVVGFDGQSIMYLSCK
jgi:hypothetical protein